MKMFVVRLNPDTRKGTPYSKYPTTEEYDKVYKDAVMDGFHEAVNFLAEDGVIRGYLPPRHLTAMRTGEAFILLTITAKGAGQGGDMIVGIQAGCRYMGENPRKGTHISKTAPQITWHYTCPESLSLLLQEPIAEARSIVLGEGGEWHRGPTWEVKHNSQKRILGTIEDLISDKACSKKFKRIVKIVSNEDDPLPRQLPIESTFEEEVVETLKSRPKEVTGNKHPAQVEIISYQYVRDPKVAAYALQRSNGICHDCKEPAPFVSKKTGLPYLEVHHIKMLKDGGPDTTDNVVALCPNCHRKKHFG